MTLSMTLPATLAAACAASTTPCTSLDSLFVYADGALVGAASVRGMEGQAYTITVPAPLGSQMWAVTSNAAGYSCASNVLVATVGVPVAVAAVRDTSRYDVMGRRVRGKMPRGIYWRKK